MCPRSRKVDQVGEAQFVIYATPEYKKSCEEFISSTTGRYFDHGYDTSVCNRNGRGRLYYSFNGRDTSSGANRKKRRIQQKGIVEEIQFVFNYN